MGYRTSNIHQGQTSLRCRVSTTRSRMAKAHNCRSGRASKCESILTGTSTLVTSCYSHLGMTGTAPEIHSTTYRARTGYTMWTVLVQRNRRRKSYRPWPRSCWRRCRRHMEGTRRFGSGLSTGQAGTRCKRTCCLRLKSCLRCNSSTQPILPVDCTCLECTRCTLERIQRQKNRIHEDTTDTR